MNRKERNERSKRLKDKCFFSFLLFFPRISLQFAVLGILETLIFFQGRCILILVTRFICFSFSYFNFVLTIFILYYYIRVFGWALGPCLVLFSHFVINTLYPNFHPSHAFYFYFFILTLFQQLFNQLEANLRNSLNFN